MPKHLVQVWKTNDARNVELDDLEKQALQAFIDYVKNFKKDDV